MSFFEWAVELRLHLEKLRGMGVKCEDVEISLHPRAFVQMLASKEFSMAHGSIGDRQVCGVRFVARPLEIAREHFSQAARDRPGDGE